MYSIFSKVAFISLSFSMVLCQEDTKRPHAQDHSKSLHLSVLLVTVPYPGHVIPFLALGEELVRRGHNVTLATTPSDFIQREVEKYGINLWSVEEGFLSQLLLTNDTIVLEAIQQSIAFQKDVLRAIDKTAITSFDIIVGDLVFFPCIPCLSRKWNITGIYLTLTVYSSPVGFHAWPFPAYQLGYTDNLTFIQRLVSTVITKFYLYFITIFFYINFLFTETICTKVNIPLSTSLYFSHNTPQIIPTSFGFEFPRATLPLTDYVGPMIPQSQPQLPQDIAEWLDWRDPRSVVYVSMGTTVVLPSGQAEMIINGATQANLSVVWSLKKSNQHILQHMTYDPGNVLISEWLPQVTILRHRSIHSAILHGGLGGVQEALSCGVPIIALPSMYDHIDISARVQHYHYGEIIYLHELTTPLVTKTLRRINTMLYRKSLKKIQKIYKNDGGASSAADLVEFYSDVGYEHLVPSYMKYNWSWVEFHNVDVYAVLILAVLLPSYLLYRLIRSCCSTVLSKSKKKQE